MKMAFRRLFFTLKQIQVHNELLKGLFAPEISQRSLYHMEECKEERGGGPFIGFGSTSDGD